MSATMLSTAQQHVVHVLEHLPHSTPVEITVTRNEYRGPFGTRITTDVKITGGFHFGELPRCPSCGRGNEAPHLHAVLRWERGRFQNYSLTGMAYQGRRGSMAEALQRITSAASRAEQAEQGAHQ